MKRLQDVLDRTNYLRLVHEFGGTRIWVPKFGNPGHRDRKYLGSRDVKIRKLKRDGESVADIARMFSISEKRVYSIVHGNKGRRKNKR